MRLSELQNKDIVDIETGKVVGKIIDITIDLKGNLISLIIEKKRFIISSFSSKDELEVNFNQIEKIGEDIILVHLENKKE